MRQIYDKALREKAVNDLQTLLDSVKGLPDGSDERAEAYTHALEAMLEKEKQMTDKVGSRGASWEIWDFSREKALPVFAVDDMVVIRPVRENDADFYVSIRMQYSIMYRVMVNVDGRSNESLFQKDLCQPKSFFCMISYRKDHCHG